jgi:hypothetical protein
MSIGADHGIKVGSVGVAVSEAHRVPTLSADNAAPDGAHQGVE